MVDHSFAYKLVIDDNIDAVYVTEFINGIEISPSLFSGRASGYNIAKACRKAAYELLVRADGVGHSGDFYHEIDVKEQVALMLEENKD